MIEALRPFEVDQVYKSIMAGFRCGVGRGLGEKRRVSIARDGAETKRNETDRSCRGGRRRRYLRTAFASRAGPAPCPENFCAFTFDNVHEFVGREIGVTAWHPVTQDEVDRFADVTPGPMTGCMSIPGAPGASWPYGGTISFGFYTLSLLTAFSHEVGLWPEGADYGLNYGLNKVRWIAPRCRSAAGFAGASFWTPSSPIRAAAFSARPVRRSKSKVGKSRRWVAEWLGLFPAQQHRKSLANSVRLAPNRKRQAWRFDESACAG